MAGVGLENVSRVFPGPVTAVDRVSFEANDGELLVLVGPSGCGKTTTLRMIAGLEEVSSGKITIGGRVVNDVAPKDRNIAMVFQNCALYPHLSVYKNMAFGLELRQGGWLRRAWRRIANPTPQGRVEICERVRAVAASLGIETLLGRMPQQLSGGERQRVALGQAIVRQPAAFLFDEPLSNLDARLRVEMRGEIKLLHKRLGATMIYVTHDQVEALSLGQRVAVMDRGAIQQIGAPLDVYDRPKNKFVASFIGTPPMNFVTGELSRSNGDGCLAGPGISIPLGQVSAPAGIVTLGIRPEDVRLAGEAESGSVPGQVTIVEPLGDTTLVTLRVGGSVGAREPLTVVAKADARSGISPGDRVGVVWDTRRMHLFDPTTGENLDCKGANQG